MALARTAGVFRLALRTQWAVVRLLGSTAAGEALPRGEDTGRRIDLAALRRERALRPAAERARPTLPADAYRSPKPNHEQLLLNKSIQACASAEAVLDLVSSHLAVLSDVNAATALLTMSKRMSKDEAATWLSGDPRFEQLLRAAQSGFDHAGTRALSLTLYACGKLGITPSAEWLLRYWPSCALKLRDFNPQDLSNAIYACGRLGVTPPDYWLQQFWHASALKVGDFVPQGLSNTLYACQQLGITPPADWLLRYWDASALKISDFNPQDLSNTLYVCGQLGITPPVDWLERYWHMCALKLGEFITQELSNTMYGCGQAGITPPDHWLQHFWHASAQKLASFDTQNFSNTLYACGQLGITPPADWLQQFWRDSTAKLAEFKTQHLANTLHACGKLGVKPHADWLHFYWHASASKMADFTPQGLSNTVFALAQLDARPPAHWLQQFSSVSEQRLPDMNHQELANTALAVATLGLWELPLWPGLWERLCRTASHNIAGWGGQELLAAHQLYQAYQAAAVERPGLLPAPSPELLAAARKSWADVRDERTSKLHADVSVCLTRMGVAHANERWCERAERSIDIAIDGSVPVAVEVDGPTHFLQDGRQDGRTRLRNRMLAAHGWRVVVVDYRAWVELQTQEQREEYLRRLLA